MLLPSLSKTGPGIVVYNLCIEFIKLGHDCKVFYFDDIQEIEMPCPIERIRFNQAIDFDDWDIIHSHMLRPNAYIWYHRSKINSASCISVTTLHNPITYKAARTGFGIIYSILIPMVWKSFIKAHDWTVCLNLETVNELPATIRKKSSVIFNGQNIDKGQSSLQAYSFSKIKTLIGNNKVLGTISSLTKRKGIDQAIRALSELPDYILLIIGSGPEKNRLEKLAFDLNVNDRVYFLGFHQRPTDFLPFIDIFFMCSESEGFPLALIEAAAYGKPTVLSDIPILKSIISTNNGVMFYRLNDIHDFAQKVKETFSSMETMGNDISQYYNKNLTAEIMADNYIDLYKLLKRC